MPKAYRAEFFDNDLNLLAWAEIGSNPIAFDYIALEGTTIQTKKTLGNVSTLNLCRIVSEDGQRYAGIVDAVTSDAISTTITIKPMLTLLDVTCYFDRTKLHSVSLERFIADILESLYAGSDALQNFTGFRTVTTSKTTNAKLNLKDNVHNLYDILTTALKKYGVVIEMDFDPAKKVVEATVGVVKDKRWFIEADLPGCMDVNVNFSDGLDGMNKLTLVNKRDESQKAVYYLHPDGKVDTRNTDRITPVKFGYEYIDEDDFPSGAEEKAFDALKPQKYDNLIELTVRADNLLVRWKDHTIGEPATIWYKGGCYKSVFTGWTDREESATLTFGAVRLELTKKLILERRRND